MNVLNCDYWAAGGATRPGALELEQSLRSHLTPALADGLGLALGRGNNYEGK